MNDYKGFNLLQIMIAVAISGPPTRAQPCQYEASYLYLGDYPFQAGPGYRERVQGITHNDDSWFITQAKDGDPEKQALWKIPVGHDLGSVNASDPGVTRLLIKDVPALANAGYWHVGDPCYYYSASAAEGYLVVPVEPGCDAMAFFKADDLQIVGIVPVCGWQDHAAWCAVDPSGLLFSSAEFEDASTINRYRVNWQDLSVRVDLQLVDVARLCDESGQLVHLSNVQGGVLSPNGDLLYLVAEGIHVFDTRTWRRVQKSTNGYGYFSYAFSSGFPDYDEPEGITFWDLDDGRAPNVRGQLHVLLLDRDWPDADDVTMKHYTNTICVDHTWAGDENGTPSRPFNTVTEANNIAWDRATIKIRAGTYPQPVTFSAYLQIVADGGTVTIGE